MRFDDNLFTCQCEKEDKKPQRFQISHFYRSLSSDMIMAVKGDMLMANYISCEV